MEVGEAPPSCMAPRSLLAVLGPQWAMRSALLQGGLAPGRMGARKELLGSEQHRHLPGPCWSQTEQRPRCIHFTRSPEGTKPRVGGIKL